MKQILNQYTKEQIRKAGVIKAIFFDVDGVLTDGKIIYNDTGKETKQFNVKDGYIISHLKKAGIIVGIITGRDSKAVSYRAAELKLDQREGVTFLLAEQNTHMALRYADYGYILESTLDPQRLDVMSELAERRDHVVLGLPFGPRHLLPIERIWRNQVFVHQHENSETFHTATLCRPLRK